MKKLSEILLEYNGYQVEDLQWLIWQACIDKLESTDL